MTAIAHPTESPAADRDKAGISWWLSAVVVLIAALLTAMLFPGDISWINDEPRLLARAWHANNEHRLANYGLMGNFGITYGPTATQIYQAMLLLTHDPFVLAPMRAGLCAGVTAIGLIWLGRSLRLPPWFALGIVMAPFLWVFHRIMWDASFAIPIGTLGLAAYASFLRHGGRWPLGLGIFCTLLLPFTHPMSGILGLPLGLHMLLRNYRALLRHWPVVVVSAGLVVGLNFQYLQHLKKELDQRQMRDTVGGQYPQELGASRVHAILAPFLSGRILGGHRYAEGSFDGVGGVDRTVTAGKISAYIIYPLIWTGFGVAAYRLTRRRKADADVAEPSPRHRFGEFTQVSADAARDSLAAMAVFSGLLQMVIFGMKQVPPEPQYFFGTFAAHVLLAWVGLQWLGTLAPRTRFVPAVLMTVYTLATAAITIGSIYVFHIRLAGKDALHPHKPAFPTLRQTMAAARGVNPYADEKAWTDIQFFLTNPHALRSPRLLLPRDPNARRHGRLLIRWGDGPHGPGTQLEVVELPENQSLPEGAKQIEITPLPPKYME